MNFSLTLENIFLEEKDIPAEFKLPSQVHQREYLSNGKMKPWNGQVSDVYSPVCVKTPQGMQRVLIGSYPVCTEVEAQESLDAAVTAYNYGRGEWPIMGVAERIQCVEKFTGRMIEQKDIIIKLIMWEIGKSFADSAKEFDRTVEYMYATIDSQKTWTATRCGQCNLCHVSASAVTAYFIKFRLAQHCDFQTQ